MSQNASAQAAGVAAAPLLEVRDLDVTYRSGTDSVRAVRGVNFTLQAGQTLGMAGESGSGKTTVALSLLRLLPPTAKVSGQVLFEGEDVLGMPWNRLRAVRWARGSVVFQGAMSALNPVRTVGQQICEPILLHEKVTRREAEARTAQLLDSVGVPARRAESYPHEMSGGQRQRVMIAMALACQPDLILADEPTTALDVIVQAQILALMADLVRERQIGMIMISHDLAVLGDTCEQLAIMYAGRIAELGPSRRVLGAPSHPYTRILSRAFPRTGDPSSRMAPQGLAGEPPDLRLDTTGCAFEPRCPDAIADCRTRQIELWPAGPQREAACVHVLPEMSATQAAESERAGGSELSAAGDAPALAVAGPASGASQVSEPGDLAAGGTAGNEPVIAVQDLRVVFPARRGRGEARAVDEVNLGIGKGEILALIGESGCGKSTLARALVGLIEPTGGEVRYGGEPLRYTNAALKEHRKHVQLVLQDPAGALNPRQNVFDLVAEGPRLHGQRANLTTRVHEALERAGLRPAAHFIGRYPHELSGGQQQRVVIAGALALDPSVLVADEPVSSLDASVRGEILKLILDLRSELSLSALIVSHDLGVAWNVADRVAVMYLGRIVEIGTVADVLLRPQHPYTKALISVLPGGELARDEQAGDGAGGPILGGEPPDPTRIPAGCRFHPRCPRLAALADGDPRAELCRTRPVPVLAATAAAAASAEDTAAGVDFSSLVACHLVSLDRDPRSVDLALTRPAMPEGTELREASR
jgi:peptide/nickel transport system ATP-binding protein